MEQNQISLEDIYKKLLKLGAELYEWKDSVMHGKVMMADARWVTVGSYNINYLSHYRSIELNADILDPEFSRQVATHMAGILEKNCQQVTNETLKKKPGMFHELKMRIAYQIIRLIGILFIKKRKINVY